MIWLRLHELSQQSLPYVPGNLDYTTGAILHIAATHQSMMTRSLWIFLLIYCQGQITLANVFPRQTTFGNSSESLASRTASSAGGTLLSGSSSATITSSAPLSVSTGSQPCAGVKGICYDCGALISHVGLNSWWTSSYDLTVGMFPVLEGLCALQQLTNDNQPLSQ